MAAGETTVGGIVGFLRMDDDQFNRTVDAAIARIRALGSMDADVDVRVDTHNGDRDLDRVDEAMRRVTRSNDRMGSSFRRSRGLMDPKVLLAAVAFGTSLLGPATAAATAALAGFTGAVGTGALAWKGFKDEIADGTVLGQQLQGQLDGLSGTLHDLESTAANAMGPGLISGLQAFNDFLPSVDDEVAALGKSLGNAFNITAGGVVSGLKTMMPLLVDGGHYAEVLAQKFADFTASQDFKDFIDYARQELPVVAESVASLTKGLVSMAEALAPIGEAGFEVFRQWGEVMSHTGDALGHATDGVKDFVHWIMTGEGPWDKQKKSADNATVSLQAVDAAITATSEAAQAQAIDVGNMTSAYGGTVSALAAATAAQEKQAASSAAATLQMQLENDAAGLLKQSLDLLNGKSLDRAAAQTAAASATLRLDKALKDNGTTLSLNTQKGVENRQAIEAKVRADQQAAEAVAKATGSTKEGTAALASSKKALEGDLRARGLLTDKVQAYIDRLYKIPKKVPPTKVDVDKTAAEQQLKALARHLSAITQPRTVTVTTQLRTIGAGVFANKKIPTSAAGGTVHSTGACLDLIPDQIGARP